MQQEEHIGRPMLASRRNPPQESDRELLSSAQRLSSAFALGKAALQSPVIQSSLSVYPESPAPAFDSDPLCPIALPYLLDNSISAE